MKSSVEIRWFFGGPEQEGVEEVGAALRQWFADMEPLGEPSARTDRYLSLDGAVDVGVKLRAEQCLQIKARTAPATPHRFSSEVEGAIDGWVKWSAIEPSKGSLKTMIERADGRWIDVHKRRWLRTYGVSGEACWPAEGPVAQGATAEICRVEVGPTRQLWWTLAFESFGEPSRLHTSLVQVAEHVLLAGDAPPPLPLTQRSSFAYPAMLARVGSGEA